MNDWLKVRDQLIYDINGYNYYFVNLKYEAGYLKGYNHKKKKWAWLFDTYIQFEGESIVLAKLVN